MYLVEKIGDDYKDIRTSNPTDMGIQPFLAHFHISKGSLKIRQLRLTQFRKLNFSYQVLVGNIKKIFERNGISNTCFLFKIMCVILDSIKKSCG